VTSAPGPGRPNSTTVRRFLALLLVAVALLLPASGAAAHGDGAEIRVVDHTGDSSGVLLTVDVLFGNDLEPAKPDFLITYVVDDDDNEVASTDRFEAGDRPGRYLVELQPPSAGSWSFVIASTNPTGLATIDIDVGAAGGGVSALLVLGGVALLAVVLGGLGIVLWRRDRSIGADRSRA
jgi:hypothetical protein